MPLAQHHTDRQKQEWCQATRNRVSKACWVTLMARPGVGERQVGKNAGEMVGGMWLEAWKGRRLRHPCTGVGVGGAFPQSPAYASPPPPMLRRVRNRSVLLQVCGRVNWDKPFGELFVSTRAWLYAILTSGCVPVRNGHRRPPGTRTAMPTAMLFVTTPSWKQPKWPSRRDSLCNIHEIRKTGYVNCF